MRLLLIDDDETVARALEQIRAGTRYDAILCDVVMPRMSGQDLHEAVTTIDREQARRIVFVSGRVHEVGVRIGKVACLPKPFDLVELRSVIDRFLPIRLHSSATTRTPVRRPTTH